MGKKIKIVGLNGSPRKYGNTVLMLEVALYAARLEGAETERIDLYDHRIQECIGCVSDNIMKCRYPCVIEDDMKKIYDIILESDGAIFATPIYWYNMSGVMKNLIDRLTALENMIFIDGKCWMEGKVAGFIAAGNDTGSIAVIQNLMSILNSMGAIIPPWALAYYASTGLVEEKDNVILDSANIGRSMALMIRCIKGIDCNINKWYDSEEDYKEKIMSFARKTRDKLRRAEKTFDLEYRIRLANKKE